MSFMLSPIDIIVLTILSLALFVYSTIIIYKNEEKLARVIWILANISFFPIVPIIYILMSKFQIKK